MFARFLMAVVLCLGLLGSIFPSDSYLVLDLYNLQRVPLVVLKLY